MTFSVLSADPGTIWPTNAKAQLSQNYNWQPGARDVKHTIQYKIRVKRTYPTKSKNYSNCVYNVYY